MNIDDLLKDMTQAALDSYEMTCEWPKATTAAWEEAREQGARPVQSLVLHSVNLAKLEWQAISMRTKAEIEAL